MKNAIILIFAILFLTAYSASAKIITVSNNPLIPAEYTVLQEAIDEADAGDIIYVHRSTTSYGNITIKKRLTLIGAGYHPDYQDAYKSQVGTISLDSIVNVSGPSNTHFIGLLCDYIYGTTDKIIKDVIIERSRFTNVFPGNSSGWIIRNNIFSTISGYNSTANLIVLNNIIIGSNNFSNFKDNVENVQVKNNIFMNNLGTIYSGTHCKNIMFFNNIFYGVSAFNIDNQLCTFNNNITYGTINDSLNISGNNSGSGNLISTDPEFEDVEPYTYKFEYSENYRLKSTSPGKNAGTDGTDIGIYGGTYPFPEDYSGTPAITKVELLNIINSVFFKDNKLKFNVKAVKKD